MSTLGKLQASSSLVDLAKLLQFTPKGLSYVLYKMPASAKYTSFEIPKKVGGTRLIQAPEPKLKLLQSNLAKILYDCVDEIERRNPIRLRVSHGFQRNRSIVTNAVAHRRRRYVLNLDLEDFFGTINFGRVRGFFVADRDFQLDPDVATIIAQISCNENMLPQGAPTSPVISNLIGNILDMRLIKIAQEFGCTYTRYVDDITLSTNRLEFPRRIARRAVFDRKRWMLGRRLKRAIHDTGFKVNSAKTRMQIRGSRQEATGLVVNEKINIKQEYYRSVRSMCHSLFKTGAYYTDVTVGDDEAGAPDYTESLAPLEGRLAHIYYVKARRDRTDREKENDGFKTPKAPVELYRRFLFYKYFVAPDCPTLVTEGKTDIVYLKTAMKALQAKFPSLAVSGDEQHTPPIRFINSSLVNQKVLKLGAGFGGMTKIISAYDWCLKPYKHRPFAYPVIFVIDCDGGGENVLKEANKISQQDIKAMSEDPFFHIRDNLYLVKTPAGADGGWSTIEDCFPEDVLKTPVDGKLFNPKKAHGDETSISKHIFAEQVVQGGSGSIDFSGFEPILNGISMAIADYSVKATAVPVAATIKSA